MGALRLFVGIYPPRSDAEALVGLLERIVAPGCRPVPVEALHLTVQFLGPRSPNELEAIVQSVERSACGLAPFALVPLRVVALPGGRRPTRVIAVETDFPAGLLELKHRLAARLARRVRRDGADRFLPHLTIGRFAGPGMEMPALDVAADRPGFVVEGVDLVRSVLTHEGARHEVVARCPLG